MNKLSALLLALLLFITTQALGSVSTPSFSQENWNKHRHDLAYASKETGVSLLEISSIVGMETGFRNNRKNPYGSAEGLGQITDHTWNAMVRIYGKEYGLNRNSSKNDPRANLVMVGVLVKHHRNLLTKKLKREVSFEEAFTAYFLGEGDGYKMIRAKGTRFAHDIVGRKTAANNWPYFYKDKAKTKPRTVNEFRKYVNAKIASSQSVYRKHTYLLAFEKELMFKDPNLGVAYVSFRN